MKNKVCALQALALNAYRCSIHDNIAPAAG